MSRSIEEENLRERLREALEREEQARAELRNARRRIAALLLEARAAGHSWRYLAFAVVPAGSEPNADPRRQRAAAALRRRLSRAQQRTQRHVIPIGTRGLEPSECSRLEQRKEATMGRLIRRKTIEEVWADDDEEVAVDVDEGADDEVGEPEDADSEEE